MLCATWRCEAEADWRDSIEQYGFCVAHANPRRHFWPVSEWAYRYVKEFG